MNRLENTVDRIFADIPVTFMNLINSIIDNKIKELVNNATKVNTATSQQKKKGHGSY